MGPEKVKYYLLRTESPVKSEDMKQGELHNTKILENVGVRSFRKLETSEFRSFPKMENIGNSGVSGNRITNKYTYLGNSPEFRVVLESCERILIRCQHLQESRTKENITILVTICVDGTALPPTIVFKNKELPEDIHCDNVARALCYELDPEGIQ